MTKIIFWLNQSTLSTRVFKVNSFFLYEQSTDAQPMIFIYILSTLDRTTRYGSRVFNDQNYEVVFAEAHVKLIPVTQTA